jgi:glycosyltransferase involved in cell wall biosynthesis
MATRSGRGVVQRSEEGIGQIVASTAIVHDYLTQRGGAERVVLALARAFPDAPVYTSLYEPESTFEEFAHVDVRPSRLNQVAALRRNHRVGLPLFATTFSRMKIDADVTVCSSSGWAHGVKTTGVKVVYCYTPARWLYQTERYLEGSLAPTLASPFLAPLRAWDRKAAKSADLYIAISSVVRGRIRSLYGREAMVIHPPVTVDSKGDGHEVEGVEPGYVLCVSRLLPYKNVDAVAEAFEELAGERLVVVGEGPLLDRYRSQAPANVRFVGGVSESQLRWLYRNSAGLVAASYEDFGLTPLEGLAFGKATAVLHGGGFLDTVVDGETGVFFDVPDPSAIADAVKRLLGSTWKPARLRQHLAGFDEDVFRAAITAAVDAVRP